MGGCSSNIVTQLSKKYGENKILDYAKAIIGEKLFDEKFMNIKN